MAAARTRPWREGARHEPREAPPLSSQKGPPCAPRTPRRGSPRSPPVTSWNCRSLFVLAFVGSAVGRRASEGPFRLQNPQRGRHHRVGGEAYGVDAAFDQEGREFRVVGRGLPADLHLAPRSVRLLY